MILSKVNKKHLKLLLLAFSSFVLIPIVACAPTIKYLPADYIDEQSTLVANGYLKLRNALFKHVYWLDKLTFEDTDYLVKKKDFLASQISLIKDAVKNMLTYMNQQKNSIHNYDDLKTKLNAFDSSLDEIKGSTNAEIENSIVMSYEIYTVWSYTSPDVKVEQNEKKSLSSFIN